MQNLIKQILESHQLKPQSLGLRFDRVALRLLASINDSAKNVVPVGKIALVTVSAPIRLPGQTSVEINLCLQRLLRPESSRVSLSKTIHTNQVTIKVVDQPRSSKVKVPKQRAIAFIHNRTTNPAQLFSLAESWLNRSHSTQPTPRSKAGSKAKT